VVFVFLAYLTKVFKKELSFAFSRFFAFRLSRLQPVRNKTKTHKAGAKIFPHQNFSRIPFKARYPLLLQRGKRLRSRRGGWSRGRDEYGDDKA